MPDRYLQLLHDLEEVLDDLQLQEADKLAALDELQKAKRHTLDEMRGLTREALDDGT